ncbi:DUF2993 domain-containing protein [Pseudonocardia endophytica]|uniref:DUF2993 family protein n=1 Tax=Pseudonocardia endophytica TaxID=401976 RepID=A0A4R1HXG0_PSEEN|nr:DUF2993 domain-containing protein [Pseudonocardia endophytica]TCK27058.1 DUF2993 family protein [Pseudonocardia endophytica]
MRRLIVAVVVLVGLLVVADFSAAAAAESTISRQMRDRLSLPEDPSVRVNGVSFLAQAATGRYRSVDVSMERLPVGSLRSRAVEVKIHDLRAPWSELTGSAPAPRFRATDARSVVTIGSGDVMRMVPRSTQLSLATVDANDIDEIVLDGGDPTLRGLDPRNAALLTATMTVRGVEQPVEVLTALQVTNDGLIRLTPRDVRLTGGDDLTAAETAALTRTFSLLIDPGKLPFRVTPTTLRVDSDGALELSGQVKDLIVGEGDRSSSSSAQG